MINIIYKEKRGDLFSAPNKYTFIHCISSDYKMGAGIAVQFEKRFKLRKELSKENRTYPDCAYAN